MVSTLLFKTVTFGFDLWRRYKFHLHFAESHCDSLTTTETQKAWKHWTDFR